MRKIVDLCLYPFKPHKVPENHEPCPQCHSMGTEDGLLKCDYCEGYGHVSNWKALEYEQSNMKQ